MRHGWVWPYHDPQEALEALLIPVILQLVPVCMGGKFMDVTCEKTFNRPGPAVIGIFKCFPLSLKQPENGRTYTGNQQYDGRVSGKTKRNAPCLTVKALRVFGSMVGLDAAKPTHGDFLILP